MMNTSPYEVPAEMRDFAERSVQQARKAFEGFMGAVQKTTGTVEETTQTAQIGAKDLSVKAVSFAEKNVAAALDLADRLVHAKDMQEIIALQTDYVKAQMEAIQAQAREMGDAVQRATGLRK